MSHAFMLIVGNLGGDPEVKEVGGSTVTEFSVATKTKRKGEDVTTWVRCAAWGKTGEIIMEHFHKGDQILVQGEFSLRSYTNRDGAEKTSLELRVDKFSFVSGSERAVNGNSAGSQGGNRNGGGQRQNRSSSGGGYDSYSRSDDEIPF